MFLRSQIFLFILFVLGACAQQVPPSGGSKDEQAPKVAGCRPENKSVRFESEKIVIRFDEFVQIKDPSQIVISPFLKDKPIIETNGKSIEVIFAKTKPEPNTTYTINFGNSIADVNEGNVLSNFSYVFATGEILDSNLVAGSIRNAFKSTPEKNILIGLYKANNFHDSLLHKRYPSYFGKSNDSGEFKIENLPNDTFFLIAFKDINADNKYQKIEPVAFLSDTLIALNEKRGYVIHLFEPNLYRSNALIDTISKQRGKYQFCFFDPKGISVTALDYKKQYTQFVKGKSGIDTFNVFIPEAPDTTRIRFRIQTPDSSYLISLKTRNKSKYPEFRITFSSPLTPLDSIQIQSTVPIDSITLQQIKWKVDTLPAQPKYFKQKSNFEWVLYYPMEENNNYSIQLIDSSIYNVYGKGIKVQPASFSPRSSKDFGNLILKFAYSGKENLIIQLIEDNTEERVVKEIKNKIPDELTIPFLNAGPYKLKVLIDKNNNGRWDNGDFGKRIQAEPVYYYFQSINIKAYWDIEQSIRLDNIIFD